MGKVVAILFFVGILAAIGLVMWMREKRIQRLRAEYQQHLAHVRGNPGAVPYALAAGRRYYAAHRSFGANIPQDEHAIANDIRAAGG